MSEQTSAILLNWKRPWNIGPICDSLLALPFCDEVIVWDNSGALELDMPGVRVIRSERNRGTYGRVLASRHASHDVLLIQDDDLICHNWTELYERFQSDHTRIVSALAPGHYRAEAHKKAYQNMGWGSIVNRKWFGVMDRWIEQYGEDPLLESKCDRIFTCLFGRFDPIPADYTPLIDPNGRRSDMSADAIYQQPQHRQLVRESVQKALALKK